MSHQKKLSSWTREDVQEWFMNSKWSEHADYFEVDGATLANFSKKELMGALGEKKGLVGIGIFKDIKRLKGKMSG